MNLLMSFIKMMWSIIASTFVSGSFFETHNGSCSWIEEYSYIVVQ